ncbi:MAG: SCP2 sterol-binding domain-containing protein [Actinobacteria bacterium]|nr:SCP2 sterol-binding domain-containing protein [Actinomycetota bacterium]
MEGLTASYIFDHLAPKFIEDNPGFPCRVNAVVSIDILGEGGGSWTFDLTDNPRVYRGLADDAKCTLTVSASDFYALLAGGSLSDCLEAFKQKRINFRGHLPTALRLERLLVSLAKDPAIAEHSRI